jgi:hypothetical protein
MGRFDALTQLDKKPAPGTPTDAALVAPAKKHAPPSLSEKAEKQKPQGTDITQHETAVPVPEQVPVRGGVRVGVPPLVPLIPKVRRVIRQRQPFDIYEDQYERLKKIAENEKGFENGRGISQMVLTAIDNYLKGHDTAEE